MPTTKTLDATPEQLVEWLRENIGRDMPLTTPRADLVAMVMASAPGDGETIEISAAPARAGKRGAARSAAEHAMSPLGATVDVDSEAAYVASRYPKAKVMNAGRFKSDPRVVIEIMEQPGPGGKRPVPVGVNSETGPALLPRGVQLNIPYSFYAVLENAVETVREWDQATGTLSERDVPRYSFRPLHLPHPDVVEAWTVAQGKLGEIEAEHLMSIRERRESLRALTA